MTALRSAGPSLVRAGLCALLLTGFASPAAAQARFHLEGRKLIDARGRQVVLHGVNVAYKVPPFYPNDRFGPRSSFTRKDAARLRRWGMNVIRLGITWQGLEPQRGDVDAHYVSRVRHFVALAGRYGIGILVDFHQDGWGSKYGGNGVAPWASIDDGQPYVSEVGHPEEYANPAVGRAFTSFWGDRDGIQKQYIRAAATLARSLRHEKAVVGYDTMNEPSCEYTAAPCSYPPSPEATAALLEPFQRRIIPALERADPNHAVFYEDWITASSAPFTMGDAPGRPLTFPRLGLSYHVYCASSDCEQGETQTMRWAKRNARLNGAWPLISEFGATDDTKTIQRVANEADSASQSWTYWTYKSYFDPYPIFFVPPKVAYATGRDDTWSVVAKDGTVKRDKLAALARVYPSAIAGRRARWRFDPARRVFHLAYRPHGRSPTIVRIPKDIQYRHGFVVKARGASYATKSKSRRLTLRAKPGATRVILRIRPRGR